MALKNTIENLPDIYHLLSEPKFAVAEITSRRKDLSVTQAVVNFLDGDIPEHFSNKEPFFYLARHIATPNFETLRAKEIADQCGLPLIVGEDLHDKFVSKNYLKKSLGKMTFETGVTKNGDTIIERRSIIDVSRNDGKKLHEVTTTKGISLHETHQQLLASYGIETFNESDWVHKHKQDDMVSFYAKFLALSVVHSIMLEFYAVEDSEFVDDVFIPAYERVKEATGYNPLICTIIQPEEEFERDWLAYPKAVLDDINELIV